VNDAIITISSTVLGAIIAALFSWLLARRASTETLERDRQQRREQKLAITLQAFVKLKTIIDHLGTLKRMIDRALSRPHAHDAQLWMLVEPIIGHPSDHQVEFTAAELALFMEAQRADLAEDMQMLARKNSTTGAVISTYNQLRAELKEKMPPPIIVQGALGTTALTPEQMRALLPHMVALNSLIEQLVVALREDVALGLKVAKEFGPALKAHFGGSDIPAFVVPDDVDALDSPP